MPNKRKKSYYFMNEGKKGKYQPQLQSGMRGYLITCGNKAEKDAKREAYSILNEYADKRYGPEYQETESKSEEDDEDIEKALQKEVDDIKKKRTAVRRFQVCDSGANSSLFVKTTLENPVELLSDIVEELHTTKSARSRYIMKMFPVVATCRAEEEKIKSTVSEYLQKTFKDLKNFTYCFIFKIRNNTGFGKHKILNSVVSIFEELGIEATVDFNNPDYTFSFDVIKSVCCMSILKDFAKYRKYNLQEITAVKCDDAANNDNAGGKKLEKEAPEENSEKDRGKCEENVDENREEKLEEEKDAENKVADCESTSENLNKVETETVDNDKETESVESVILGDDKETEIEIIDDNNDNDLSV